MAQSLKVDAIKRTPDGGFEIFVTDKRGVQESHTFASRREAMGEMYILIDDEASKRIILAAIIAKGLRATQDGDTTDDLDALKNLTFTINPKAARNLMVMS